MVEGLVQHIEPWLGLAREQAAQQCRDYMQIWALGSLLSLGLALQKSRQPEVGLGQSIEPGLSLEGEHAGKP